MRNTILVVFAAFIIALLGIVGYYISYTHDIQANLAKFEAEAASRKKVAVDIAVTPPPNTPRDQVLYISGSVPALGNWDAAGIPLQPEADGRQHAEVELLSGIDYAFKVTRGTWSTVEADTHGKTIANRTFIAAPKQVISATVANWIDEGKAVPGRVTLTGDIRLHKKFHSDILNNERTLIIYLPPGYDQSTARYPVLYMQDGQNLFDESTSYQGVEWRMDETAHALIAAHQIAPIIIIGIYNTEQRTAEFTPKSLAGKGPADGEQYARMVVTEIKPFIDSHYRTLTDRAHTGIGGASQGALIAMYTAKENPTTFGQMLLMSPWLQLNGKSVLADWLDNGQWLRGDRIYIEMGSEPGDNYPTTDPVADAKPFVAALEKAGLASGRDLDYREIIGGRHNEAAWASTIAQPLRFLYGITGVAATQ